MSSTNSSEDAEMQNLSDDSTAASHTHRLSRILFPGAEDEADDSDEDDLDFTDSEDDTDEQEKEDAEAGDDSDSAAGWRRRDPDGGPSSDEEEDLAQESRALAEDEDTSARESSEARSSAQRLESIKRVRDLMEEVLALHKDAKAYQPESRSKRPQDKIKLTHPVLSAIDLLRFDLEQSIKHICETFKIHSSLVRRRLGFCFEVGRRRSDWVRYVKWIRYNDRTMASIKSGKEWTRQAASKWDAIKDDAQKRKRTLAKVDRWERQYLASLDEKAAAKLMNRFGTQASKFVRAAEVNDGIRAVVFAAHPHTMARTVAAGSAKSLELFYAATKGSEHIDHLRRNFRSLTHSFPPESTIPYGTKKKSADINYEAMKYPHFKRDISPALIRWVDAGLKKHRKDARRAGWLGTSSKFKTTMTYSGLFDILAAVDLCVEGWPLACRSYLSSDTPNTLRITAGSLKNCNAWDKKVAPVFWGALNRKRIKIVVAPPATSMLQSTGRTTAQ
ncbi:hypothetical protein V8E36_008386 [Tilletia maclaganii]